MSIAAKSIAIVLLAYLLGSIPFGVLVGRLKGVDPRTVGSGNIGATNVMRALGPLLALPVLLLDMAKGYVPVIVAMRFCERHLIEDMLVMPPEYRLSVFGVLLVFATAFAAMLGHLFPIYLRFRGGKGVAVAGGIIFALSPIVGCIAAVTFFAALIATRYVSVASTLAAISIPIAGVISGDNAVVNGRLTCPHITFQFGLIAVAFVVYKHRSNYARLRAGTEPKFGQNAHKKAN